MLKDFRSWLEAKDSEPASAARRGYVEIAAVRLTLIEITELIDR